MFRKLKALYKLYWKFSPWLLEYLATFPTSGAFFQLKQVSLHPNDQATSLEVLVTGTDEELRARFNKIFDEIGGEERYLFK
jgi:hypothetical protein